MNITDHQKDYSQPHVAVLMCTYQANHYLYEQLASINDQSHSELSLWISKDSDDETTSEILGEFEKTQDKLRSLRIMSGPQKGFSANFLSLLNRDEIHADYYAFCDQDDIWDPGKIETAVKKLCSFNADRPAVYCSRTILVDNNGKAIGFSPLFSRPPSFKNALVQSLAGGNTMVVNRAARELLRKAGNLDVVCHDWWVYLIVTGAGGQVFYDPVPTVRYRQHGGNLIGANDSWRSSLVRLQSVFANRFLDWQDINLKALMQNKELLTPENREILDDFIKVRSSGIMERLYWLIKSGVYRQTTRGNISLFIAVVLGKV